MSQEIPDLHMLTNNICEILEYMNLDEMVQLKNANQMQYEVHIDKHFTEFSNKYPTLLTLLLENKEDNLHKLLHMINMLHEIDNSHISMDDAVDTLREDLANEYIYPKFGGKQQFEDSIKNRNT
jgi:hypothetical protein